MPKTKLNTPSNCQAVRIGSVTLSPKLVTLLENLQNNDVKGGLKDRIARNVFYLIRSDISEEFADDTKEIVGYCQYLYDIISELEKEGGDSHEC